VVVIPFLLARWRLISAGGLAVLLLWAGWHVRSRLAQADADSLALDQARQDMAEMGRRIADAEAIGKADAAAATAYAARAADLERQADQLRQAVFVAVQRRNLVTEGTPDAPAPVLSRAFRLCWNAATSGDPAAAAACEAGSGDAAGGSAVPAAGLVRSGLAP
jgi:hypothetical protein